MELVQQIINDLIDDEKSLNSALLKTKVLASRIQNSELLTWVNSELSGYKKYEDLPDYRKNIFNDLKGNFLNGRMKYVNTQIPTVGLEEEFESQLRTSEFMMSISSLEKLIKSEKSSILTSPVRAEIAAIIEDNWQNMGNPYLQIISVYKEMSKNSIVEIINNVRNKLLDFMLAIDGKFGDLATISDLKMKKDEVKSIVNNTIIQGDGNVLNTGTKVQIKNSPKIKKNSKKDLTSELKKIGVEDEDIVELAEIIDAEEPDIDNNKFGVIVNKWIGKMIQKSIDGSWNVSIGAAGSILSEIIQKYYGM
ncbi:hypothetical protein [Aequorivita capsosiphonis]|uniref:AbiTii domain-containing protein n=1 Tax=Aequorivita capsosiphonis TaxID=487317 RepID=UPI000403FF7C|nr:hypothetical protein [Aequorivita capsosiphonis]